MEDYCEFWLIFCPQQSIKSWIRARTFSELIPEHPDSEDLVRGFSDDHHTILNTNTLIFQFLSPWMFIPTCRKAAVIVTRPRREQGSCHVQTQPRLWVEHFVLMQPSNVETTSSSWFRRQQHYSQCRASRQLRAGGSRIRAEQQPADTCAESRGSGPVMCRRVSLYVNRHVSGQSELWQKIILKQ